ncbi:MAG: DUF475 domain-containing protein [Chloroflexi bacterium]|nr:DUF475 domain-containing protein [Chloroflexota bacterium]
MFALDLRHLIIALEVAFLDSLLSVDNALVLAVMVEHLPTQQRTRALRYGILGAYLFRGASLFVVSLVIANPWIRVGGAAYLLWLGLSHLIGADKDDNGSTARRKVTTGFWLTVLNVEMADLIFSLDNIVATVAFAPDEILMVVFGVFVSIIVIRYVAGVFLRMLARFPVLRTTAYVIVVFLGVKLILESGLLDQFVHIAFDEYLTFGIICGIIALSLVYERARKMLAARQAPKPGVPAAEEHCS